MRWTIGARSTRIGSTRGTRWRGSCSRRAESRPPARFWAFSASTKRLRAQAASAGHDYAAEVVLFVLDPAARGHGLGRRMFETLMDAFRLAGVRDYFLFTDTTCDVGFYVHRGLTQVCEQSLPASVPGENPSSFYLYEGSVPEPA